VARIGFTLLAVILAAALVNAQEMSQVSRDPQPDPKSPFAENPQACSPPERERLLVPGAVAKRAKLKARLVDLLRQSLYDDAKGIVNTPLEKEIRKLEDKLKNDKLD
jgi:hypothetical protein